MIPRLKSFRPRPENIVIIVSLTNTNVRPFVVSISGIYNSGSHLPCHNDYRRLNFSLTQTQRLNSQQTKEPSTISNNLTFLKARQVHSSGEVLLVGEDQHRHSLSLGQPVAFFLYLLVFIFASSEHLNLLEHFVSEVSQYFV